MSIKRVYLSDRPLTLNLKELRNQQNRLYEIQKTLNNPEDIEVIEGLLNLLRAIIDIVDPPEGSENYARTYKAIKD